MTAAVELVGVTKRFVSHRSGVHTAISDVTLSVREKEFVAIVGPTGCGKSTTLSLISGLEQPSAGDVRVNGQEVQGIPDGVGYMFQNDAMMPWRTVLANVSAGLVWSGVAKRQATERARDWIGRVGLAGFESYYMHQLSGGMRRRVALAQTLVTEPTILLMDEPFSALDVQTRAMMHDGLLQLWQGTDAAVVFVTHDLEEAIVLADRVIVMSSSPATVKDVFPVRLDRPRAVEELRMTSAFTDTYREIWSSLSAEVRIARKEAFGVG